MKFGIQLLTAFIVGSSFAILPVSARAAADDIITVDKVMTHDPVMIKEKDTYYLFATGQGISVMSSRDMKNWKFEPSVFSEAPKWAVELIDGYNGHTWAPDVIYHNGLYHLFYSCSAFGKNTSAIGHATTPTLDREDPRFKWTDHGMVIQSVPNRDSWNAIDPNIIIDEKGTPWMSFGSFWDGIKLVRLTDDLNAVAEPQEWYSISRRQRSVNVKAVDAGDGAVEAPFIMKHGEYYYLFVSFDYCCRGLKSDYKVAVGRSKDVRGPYLDRDGKSMEHGGGTIIVKGDKNWAGIGHCAAYKFEGKYYFIAHAYSVKNDGTPMLYVRTIKWTEDGWPIVG